MALPERLVADRPVEPLDIFALPKSVWLDDVDSYTQALTLDQLTRPGFSLHRLLERMAPTHWRGAHEKEPLHRRTDDCDAT
jgi:hypothetical protein